MSRSMTTIRLRILQSELRRKYGSQDTNPDRLDASAQGQSSRAEGEARGRSGQQVYFAVVHALLSDGGEARTRRDRGRRGRERIPRLRGRNRGLLDRTLSSGSGGGDPEAGGGADSHLGHRLLLRIDGGAGGAAVARRADARATQSLLRQLGRGSGRSGHEVGALSHQAAAD